ncbi:MAG: hypothetical protein WC558_13225 [Patulibacter sp.]
MRVLLLVTTFAALVAGAAVAAARLRLARIARRNGVRIAELDNDTGRVADSKLVYSIQTATITTPTEQLEPLWSPEHLERFARAYWVFMERFSLGLVRVHYDEHGRYVCLLHRRIVLLGFGEPEYEFDSDHGLVRWPIRRGLMVARSDHDQGKLEIEVHRRDGVEGPRDREPMTQVELELEVADFHPAMSSGILRWIYTNTQSRYHVLLAYGFIRSLGRGELPESAVGRFAARLADDLAVSAAEEIADEHGTAAAPRD